MILQKEKFANDYMEQPHTSFEFQMDKNEAYHNPVHIHQLPQPSL